MKFNKLFKKLLKFDKSFRMKNKTIFLDPNNPDRYDGLDDGKKLNIILSPSLYWVKKVTLPVKYIRDVKKLLPSLFEEILPSGNYSYTAYKQGDKFFIFAYEDRVIMDLLSHFGISLSHITGIYFAQSELQNIEGAVNINETQSIYVQDDIVVLVPCCWIEETGDLDLVDIRLSKHKVSLQHYAHIVDNSSLYKIVAILVILIIILLSEIVMSKYKTADILKQNDEVFSSYKLKPTMFQNKSMLKKYIKIHKRQTDIRDYISYVLKFKLQDSQKLIELEINNLVLKAKFSGASNTMSSSMQKMLKSKNVKSKLNLQGTILSLEIEL